MVHTLRGHICARNVEFVSEMHVLLSHPSKTACRIVALTLVLWLGGVGCLVGCEMEPDAFAHSAPEISASSTSCPASSGHTCCHQQERDPDAANIGTLPSSSGELSCCPFANWAVEAARKVRSVDAPLAVAASKLLSLPTASGYTSPPIAQGRDPDRRDTYLRCCVFLI